MWFFKKQKREEVPVLPHHDLGAAIEIIASNEAAREMAEKARAANAQLQELLVENGFTLKIYLAAGGSHPKHSGDNK